MRESRHFKAAILDLGGVFIDWNPRHLYRSLFPDDEAGMERFLAQVTTAAWNHELDAGRPFAEAIAELQREHPDKADLIAAYRDRWPEMLGEVNLETAAIVRDLRSRGLRVFALSNWSAETFPHARAVAQELALFDDIQISGEARITKPDPRAFELAVTRFKVDPRETLFVDDMQANVDAAAVLGFTGIRFTSATALRDTLARLGVL
ncbi:MAG TPA: HAD family phosphatase [Candidatus Limnocylindrales bacterium]